MNKILKIIVAQAIMLIVFSIYCLLPTHPDKTILDKFKNNQIKYENIILKTDYSILINYDLPVFRKRLWVIDNRTKEEIINTYVSQSFNSGIIYANKFSNKVGSEISSLGCFLTGQTYVGKYGYSMKIIGLAKGINDNVLDRKIIFHSRYLPFYSKACFETFPKDNREIISLTKGGRFIYVHRSNYETIN